MEQAATPGGLGLPCSPKQALALYQHLFRYPAGLGQLWAALRQVQEGPACPSGLELPTMLLEMERSRRAQEQLLWDLELLTGAGLGLFWPPQAQFCGLRDEAQCAWRQHSKPRGRMGGGSERLMSGSSRLCPSPQAGDSLNQNHQLLKGAQMQEVHLRQRLHSCRGQTADPSSALDMGEPGSGTDPRGESPDRPAESAPGCLQELKVTTTSSFGEPRSSEFKVEVSKHPKQEPSQDLAQREERGQAEPTIQRPCQLPSRSLRRTKLTQGAPGPSGLPSQGLPEPQDPPEGLCWSLGQERAELQKLLRTEIPQSQREDDPQEQKEETPQGQRGEAHPRENKEVPPSQREKTNHSQSGEVSQTGREEISEGQRWEAPQGDNKEAPEGQRGNRPKCQRREALLETSKETPQGGEVKILQSSKDRDLISQGWEGAQREAPTQPQEEGDSLGIPGDFCRSLGEQMSKPGGRERPGPWGRSAQLMQGKADGQRRESAPAAGEQRAARDGARAPLPSPRPPARPLLPGPGAVMLAALSPGGSEQQERHPHRLQDPGGGPGPSAQEVGEARGLRAGAPGERRGGAEAPKAPKAAWPGPPSREKASAGVSAAQQETALQRLLDLHREARRRRRQDHEQQRLRVLERLRIARNRHCRVHPLGPPPSPAQLPPQEDAAGQRRALREQLEQVHRERTGRLRALGARNTQNFQQLLWPPGAEEPAPGE